MSVNITYIQIEISLHIKLQFTFAVLPRLQTIQCLNHLYSYFWGEDNVGVVHRIFRSQLHSEYK